MRRMLGLAPSPADLWRARKLLAAKVEEEEEEKKQEPVKKVKAQADDDEAEAKEEEEQPAKKVKAQAQEAEKEEEEQPARQQEDPAVIEEEAEEEEGKEGKPRAATAPWARRMRKSLDQRQPWERDAKPEGVPVASADGRVSAAALQVGLYLPLLLPPCSFGDDLNFCLGQRWLIEPLDDGAGSSLPADLYAQQRLARLTARPTPQGASRLTASSAAGACDSGLSGAGSPQCWTLAYDQCIDGFASRAHLPRHVVANEPSVLASLYQSTFSSGSFGNPATPPAQYSRVCLANTATAGSQACKDVAPNDYLIQVVGIRPASYGPCDFQAGAVYVVTAAVDVGGRVEAYNTSSPALSRR
ncbi:expressed protein [Chlorella variabilis]|uniref:Expressed protein n=1 Tax=Chlorella variabilis TaxID=554065 RepID=E1ZRD1_CHLVA|nr:expressed protein [Chlorella variabilis]EFN51608.1 expressed protein [Chlorella variabilis]|eukprot:XP_005843710.1 expressed protein [Chlorella variabilis]